MPPEECVSFATASAIAEVDALEQELLATVRKARQSLPVDAQYRLLDHLNAVANDEFGDEFDRLND